MKFYALTQHAPGPGRLRFFLTPENFRTVATCPMCGGRTVEACFPPYIVEYEFGKVFDIVALFNVLLIRSDRVDLMDAIRGLEPAQFEFKQGGSSVYENRHHVPSPVVEYRGPELSAFQPERTFFQEDSVGVVHKESVCPVCGRVVLNTDAMFERPEARGFEFREADLEGRNAFLLKPRDWIYGHVCVTEALMDQLQQLKCKNLRYLFRGNLV